jgi:fatty-acyl-CoA synthase
MGLTDTDWIKKWAVYTPNRMAFREHDRDLQWTYKEFNQRVDSLAMHLKNEYKIKKNDRIAVFSKNRAEYVFLFFACIKLGSILIPLNYRLMPRELALLLGDAQPHLVFHEQDLGGILEKVHLSASMMKLSPIEELSYFLTSDVGQDPSVIPQKITEDDVVMILYTSGTTGMPKGAIINHRMLFWNSINTGLRLNLTSDDHTQSFAPFFHTGGWNVLLTPFVHHGASHTILSSFDSQLILKLMEEERATLLFAVPTMMQMIADTPGFETADLSTVRYAIVGGAPMPVPLINEWHEKGIAIRQGYGLTEVGPNCFSLHQDDAIRKIGSIGFPNFYIEASIRDDQGQACAIHQVGELWLKGPVVTPGYWHNDDATTKTITDGWFHTGDMVKKDEQGYFYVVDRKKNMFISGGENVYPAEVEQLLQEHPSVKEAAVIGVADQKWGEVGKAFVVLKKDATMTGKDLRAFCQGQLAKYKIPKYFDFIPKLPKNEAGKIDRKKLSSENY